MFSCNSRNSWGAFLVAFVSAAMISVDVLVVSVAAAGLVTRVPDLALQFFFVHAEGRARGLDHVFFKHGAAEIIGAVAERKLRYLRPLSDPRGLNIGHIVQTSKAECKPSE